MLRQLIMSIVGIYTAYLTMSLFSQKLYNTQYVSINPNIPNSKFQYPFLFIWFGSLLCALFGFAKSYFTNERANPISLKEQATLGVLYTANIATTNYSLLYISYPVQVIGRNIRLLFVVLVGAFFSRVKKQEAHIKLRGHKIIIASFITVGVLLFYFAKETNKDKGDKHDPQNEWIGYILLLASVMADALFADSQAYSKSTFKPTANHLFTAANLFTFIFCFIYSIFIQKSFFPSIQFVMNYPQALKEMILIGVLQVLGQACIYYVVTNFKQHVFPLISTTRKIITVLLSIFIFHHTINNWQWLAISIVFFGMFYELYEELQHTKQKDIKKEKIKDSEQQAQGLKNV